MNAERIPGKQPDETLKQFVRKFSTLEGRQPRAMVCQNQERKADEKVKVISVDLAGLGFDVDIGIPSDSFKELGMNAIENDADVLILLLPPSDLNREFVSDLEEFFSEKGYSDLLILNLPEDYSPQYFIEVLIQWFEQTLE